MLYLLELGSVEQNIAKQAMRYGKQLPERIANAPRLIEGLHVYLQAFFDLDTERSHGMGLSRIPWSSVADYANAYKFDEDQTADLIHFIRAMDNAHLARLNEQRDNK